MSALPARAILWWSLALGSVLLGLAWIRAGESGCLSFDRDWLVLADAWRSPALDAVLRSATWLGSLTILLPVALVCAILLWRRGHRREAGFLLAALLGAALFAQLGKQMVQRPRPVMFPALASVASPLSFPSAHAAQATAFAAAVAAILARLAPARTPPAVAAMISLVLLVGFSRTYLQVHYPSDVVAGIAAAGCWVAGLHAWVLARVSPARA